MPANKITVDWIRGACHRSGVLSALTAYDYPMARLLDGAGIEILLVGDSVGMVVLGFPDTTHVTMNHMVHHTEAVARARPRALVVADLPYESYPGPVEAVANARLLLAAGAEAVKLEGGVEKESIIRALVSEQIPVMGHLGMLPQSILQEGGVYRRKGKSIQEQEYLGKSIDALVSAGVFAIVLELVEADVAKSLTARSSVPTIGIGSGPDCTGQILVTHDLVGFCPWFRPRFVTPLADVAAAIQSAAVRFQGGESVSR